MEENIIDRLVREFRHLASLNETDLRVALERIIPAQPEATEVDLEEVIAARVQARLDELDAAPKTGANAEKAKPLPPVGEQDSPSEAALEAMEDSSAQSAAEALEEAKE